MFSPFAGSESRSCGTCAASIGTSDGWHLWCSRHRIVVVYPCGLWELAPGADDFKAVRPSGALAQSTTERNAR